MKRILIGAAAGAIVYVAYKISMGVTPQQIPSLVLVPNPPLWITMAAGAVLAQVAG